MFLSHPAICVVLEGMNSPVGPSKSLLCLCKETLMDQGPPVVEEIVHLLIHAIRLPGFMFYKKRPTWAD